MIINITGFELNERKVCLEIRDPKWDTLQEFNYVVRGIFMPKYMLVATMYRNHRVITVILFWLW